MSAHAAPSRLQVLATTLRRPGIGRSIAQTASYNMAANIAAAAGGIILARTVGPTVRGEYAAITAWFGLALMVGEMGQPAAICYYVARDPLRGREYVATSRGMMLITGALALVVGILISPVLGHGNAGLTVGYRIAFSGSIVGFVGASYTASLQARNLDGWNKVRLSQPVLGFIAIGVLWRIRLLTLDAALAAIVITMLLQLVLAYRSCRRIGLTPGRARIRLVTPLAGYGVAQIASLTPATVNAYLDQLVLSQIVPVADLGRYAIAVSMTLLPVPLVSAIGYVAFPKLAAQRLVTERSQRLQRMAVLVSAGVAAGILVPIAAAAYWMVPFVLGAAYRAAVPLIWVLTPGGIFLACGQVVGNLLRGVNRPLVVARSEGLAAIFTVVLLVALLPFLGVAAAAIASTVAYGIAFAVMIRCLWRLPRETDDSRPSKAVASRPVPARRAAYRLTRRAAISATDMACRAAGRQQVIRAAHFVLLRASLELPDEPVMSTESSLQQWILSLSEPGQAIRIVEVGANTGQWSAAMIVAARQAERLDDLDLHAFEPSPLAFAQLSEALRGQTVTLRRSTLGTQPGSWAPLRPALGVGSRARHAAPSAQAGAFSEEVPAVALADYANQAGLGDIALVRIDAAGHDPGVLRGAWQMFAEQRISVAQFEYSHRCTFARSYLLEAFELLRPLGYQVGKLTPYGVEFCPERYFEAETFLEGSYVACTARAAMRLSSVASQECAAARK